MTNEAKQQEWNPETVLSYEVYDPLRREVVDLRDWLKLLGIYRAQKVELSVYRELNKPFPHGTEIGPVVE